MSYAEQPNQSFPMKPPLQDKVREAMQKRLHKQPADKPQPVDLCGCVPPQESDVKPSK